ncbi:hypothetical protein BDY21DRAFT_331487 [Lineolata rhizophorae]|uniref:Uncharacterized protein n=1 Tax=Lineolata rhizophorae TaxID=578093 RepID=A0A6A6PBQ9_9PEZI|nr:hypothetical protein BDY21DRAFT_331487 [Lineolata rhizophorae]
MPSGANVLCTHNGRLAVAANEPTYLHSARAFCTLRQTIEHRSRSAARLRATEPRRETGRSTGRRRWFTAATYTHTYIHMPGAGRFGPSNAWRHGCCGCSSPRNEKAARCSRTAGRPARDRHGRSGPLSRLSRQPPSPRLHVGLDECGDIETNTQLVDPGAASLHQQVNRRQLLARLQEVGRRKWAASCRRDGRKRRRVVGALCARL